jgi:hypothetical protein
MVFSILLIRLVYKILKFTYEPHSDVKLRFMAQLMMDEGGPFGDVQLTDLDFPANYVHMAHPDDNKVTAAPTPIEIVFHNVPYHKRILIRMSFRCDG